MQREVSNSLDSRAAYLLPALFDPMRIVLSAYTVVLLLPALASCDVPGSVPPEPVRPATRILDIRQTPSPVVPGDSVTVRVVVEDSLNTRLVYFFSFARVVTSESRTGAVRFRAPETAGRYYGEISVSDPNPPSPYVTDARKGFELVVTAQN